jgi:signal transduction histidine kinase
MSVRDRGRGIDPRDIEHIFGEFVRGRMAEDDGGTGLGLASVRELVRQQNGTVTIQSEVGVGTTVTVELPSHAYLKPSAPSQRSGSASDVVVTPPAVVDGAGEVAPSPATTGHCPG